MQKRKIILIIFIMLGLLFGAKVAYIKYDNKKQEIQEYKEIEIKKRNVALQMNVGNGDMDYNKVNKVELQVKLYAYFHDTGIEITLEDIKDYIENDEYNDEINAYIDWDYRNISKEREYLYSINDIEKKYINENIRLYDKENFQTTLEQLNEFEKLYRDPNYVIDNRVFEGYGEFISK